MPRSRFSQKNFVGSGCSSEDRIQRETFACAFAEASGWHEEKKSIAQDEGHTHAHRERYARVRSTQQPSSTGTKSMAAASAEKSPSFPRPASPPPLPLPLSRRRSAHYGYRVTRKSEVNARNVARRAEKKREPRAVKTSESAVREKHGRTERRIHFNVRFYCGQPLSADTDCYAIRAESRFRIRRLALPRLRRVSFPASPPSPPAATPPPQVFNFRRALSRRYVVGFVTVSKRRGTIAVKYFTYVFSLLSAVLHAVLLRVSGNRTRLDAQPK